MVLAHDFDVAAVVAGFPWLGRGTRGVLVGNTRAMWAEFVAACPDFATEHDHPLDRWVEQIVEAAYPGETIFYAHRQYDGAFLPFGQLAAAVGLGALSPQHLLIHPIYGPWIALRAVVVTGGEAPVRAPIARPCACDGSCELAYARALAATGWEAWLAVRDACSHGRAWRYSDEQVRYHYTRSLGVVDSGSVR